MSYYNTITNRKYPTLPESYAGVSHYPMATHRHTQDGFYPLVELILPDGYQKISGTQTYTLDGDVVRENWQTQTDAEACAERVASITPELWQTASLFRTILRLHFGDNAETNEAITEDSITAYFVNRRLTLSASERTDDAADSILLTNGFAAITEWTGDGTVWTFPWAQLTEGSE